MNTALNSVSGSLDTIGAVLENPTLSNSVEEGWLLSTFAEKQIPNVVQELLHRNDESPDAQTTMLERMASNATADQRGLIVKGLLQYERERSHVWQKAQGANTPLPAALAHRERELARLGIAQDKMPEVSELLMANKIAAHLRKGEYDMAGQLLEHATPATAAQVTRALLDKHDAGTTMDEHALVLLAPHVTASVFQGISAGVWLHECMQVESRGLLISAQAGQDETAKLALRIGQMSPRDAAHEVLGLVSDKKFNTDEQREFFQVLAHVDEGRPQWQERQLEIAKALLPEHATEAEAFVDTAKTVGSKAGTHRLDKQWQEISGEQRDLQRLGTLAGEVAALLKQPEGGKRIAELYEGVSPKLRSQLTNAVLDRSPPDDRFETMSELQDKVGGDGHTHVLNDSSSVLNHKLVDFRKGQAASFQINGDSVETRRSLGELFGIEYDSLDDEGRKIVGNIAQRVIKLGGPDAKVERLSYLFVDDRHGRPPEHKAFALFTGKDGVRQLVDENGTSYKLDDTAGDDDAKRYRDFLQNSPFPEEARVVLAKGARATSDAANFVHKAHTPDWMERISTPLNIVAGTGALASTVGVLAPVVLTILAPEVAIPMWILRGMALAPTLMMASNAIGLATSVETVNRKLTHNQELTVWDKMDIALNVTGMGEAATLGKAGMLIGESQHLLRNAKIAKGLGNWEQAVANSARGFALQQTARPLGQLGRVFENSVVHYGQMIGNGVSMAHGVVDLWVNRKEMSRSELVAAWSTMALNGGNMALSASAHSWINKRLNPTPPHGAAAKPVDPSAPVKGAATATATATATHADAQVASPVASEVSAEPKVTEESQPPVAPKRPSNTHQYDWSGGKLDPDAAVRDVVQVHQQGELEFMRLQRRRQAIETRSDQFPVSGIRNEADAAHVHAEPEETFTNPNAPKLRVVESDIDTPVKARRVWEKFQKQSDRQQLDTNKLQDELHHGTEALGMYAHKIDHARKEVAEAEVVAETKRGTDQDEFFGKRLQRLRKDLDKDVREYEALSHKLVPVLEKLDGAVKRNAQLKAETAMAALAHKTFEHLADATKITEDDLAVLETARADTFHNLEVIQAESSGAVKAFKLHVEHHLHEHGHEHGPDESSRRQAAQSLRDRLVPAEQELADANAELKVHEEAFETAAKAALVNQPATWSIDAELQAVELYLGATAAKLLTPADIDAAIALYPSDSLEHLGAKLIQSRAKVNGLSANLTALNQQIAQALVSHPPVIKAAPGGRRVFDLASSAEQVERSSKALGEAQESAKALREELVEAETEEKRAVKEANELWEKYEGVDPANLPREQKRTANVKAEEARAAIASVDYTQAQLRRLEEQVKELGLVQARAEAAHAAVGKAVASLSGRTSSAASMHNPRTLLAAQALQQFDEQSRVVTDLVKRRLAVDWRRPRIVEGVTFGTLPHQRPGDPDIPKNFKPNPKLTEDKTTGKVNSFEHNKFDWTVFNWFSKIDFALSKGREKWVGKISTTPENFNAYEKLSGQSRDGEFAVDPMVQERVEIGGGLEEVVSDGHTHRAGYDGRAALLMQRGGTRFVDAIVRHGALHEPTLLGKVHDYWTHGLTRDVDLYMNARRPLTALLEFVSPTGRVQSGSIPQGCCGGHGHYSHVDAPRLNLEQAKKTDDRDGTEITRMFRAYESSVEGIKTAKKNTEDALVKLRMLDPSVVAADRHAEAVAYAQQRMQDLPALIDSIGDRASRDARQVKFWAKKATGAREYADKLLSSVSRLDMFMTGVDPSKTDTVTHARNMLLKHPGVFVGVGELTINKEIVTVSLGKNSFEIGAPALKHFLKFAESTGMVVLIHNDRGRHGLHHHDHRPVASQSADEYGDDFVKMIGQYKNLNAIWAHTGIGRFVRPDLSPSEVKIVAHGIEKTIKVPKAMAQLYKWAEAAPHMKFDISWNDVGQAYLTDPRMRKSIADFLIRYQDRVNFGSDTVMPFNKGMYNQALTTYLPLFKDIALRDSEALWKILRGNYDRMMDKASRDVAAWTEGELHKQTGRRAEVDTMNRMVKAREDFRQDIGAQARQKFEEWVDRLYGNIYKKHALDRSGTANNNGQPVADITVQKEIENSYAPANDQHWKGEVHGAGTPGGNLYTPKKRLIGGVLATGAMGGALWAGHALLNTAGGQAHNLHLTAYMGRAALGLTKAVGLDWMRFGWEQLAEEGRTNNRNLDTLINRLYRYARAFGLPEDRLLEVTRLAEQFRMNYAYLASLEIDKATGWTKEHRFNVIMSEVGHFLIGIDRAMGVQASSLNPFDPRTRPGQAVRGATALTLGINVVHGVSDALAGNFSSAAFTLGNALNLGYTTAGLGSGLAGFNWEERKPFRMMRLGSSAALTAGGVGWVVGSAAQALASPLDFAKFAFSVGYAFSEVRQTDIDFRRAFNRSMHGPTPSTWPSYIMGISTLGRVGLMFFDKDDKKGDDPKEDKGLGGHVQPGGTTGSSDSKNPVAPVVTADPAALSPSRVPKPAASSVSVMRPYSEPAARPKAAVASEDTGHVAHKHAVQDWPTIPHHPAVETWWQDQTHVRGHHFVKAAMATAAFDAAQMEPHDDNHNDNGSIDGLDGTPQGDASGDEQAEFDWVRPGDSLSKIARRHADTLSDDGDPRTALDNLMAINAPIFHFNPALVGNDNVGHGDPDKIWPGMLVKVSRPH